VLAAAPLPGQPRLEAVVLAACCGCCWGGAARALLGPCWDAAGVLGICRVQIHAMQQGRAAKRSAVPIRSSTWDMALLLLLLQEVCEDNGAATRA
jgi:hypothetical protein